MPVVYRTPSLIGMFSRTGHWTLTWATSIQFTYSHQHRSDYPKNIWWRIQILKPLTRQFSPSNVFRGQGNSVSMANIKTFIFRNVTPCHQDTEGNMILRNFGALLWECTASYPRSWQCSRSPLWKQQPLLRWTARRIIGDRFLNFRFVTVRRHAPRPFQLYS
jgi:hypothetical protein